MFLIRTIVPIIIAIVAAYYLLSPQSCDADCLAQKSANQTTQKPTILATRQESSKPSLNSASPADFNNQLQEPGVTLLDVRTAEEYSQGHIAKSRNIDFYDLSVFEASLDALDKNGRYLIYCQSGNRSGQVMEIMEQKGFKNVTDLAGGISAWSASNYPIE